MKQNIHQGFDFSQLGGFPLNQQRLEWMQAAYAELSGGLAAMFGDNVIVAGCIVSGQTVSDGWIVVNGELLPFVGAQTGVLSTFIIRETTTALTFKDGMQKSVQFRKYAQFGTSSDSLQWSSLTRLPSMKDVVNNISTVKTDLSTHANDKNNPHDVTIGQLGIMTGSFDISPNNSVKENAIAGSITPEEYIIDCHIIQKGTAVGTSGYTDITNQVLTSVLLYNTLVAERPMSVIAVTYDSASMSSDKEYKCYYALTKTS